MTSFYLINYLKHCISYTAVHTNGTNFTQKIGVVNKHYLLHRTKCVRCQTRKYCARTEAEGDILCDERGSSKGMNKIAQWGAAWFVMVIEWWWVVNWKTVGQMGQEKCTGEIKIHTTFYLDSPKERHFGRSWYREDVQVNVVNCTIPVSFRSVK